MQRYFVILLQNTYNRLRCNLAVSTGYRSPLYKPPQLIQLRGFFADHFAVAGLKIDCAIDKLSEPLAVSTTKCAASSYEMILAVESCPLRQNQLCLPEQSNFAPLPRNTSLRIPADMSWYRA